MSNLPSTHVKATHFCNKCGWSGVPDEHDRHPRPNDGETCPYWSRKIGRV